MAALRIIFMGTAELACNSLDALTYQPDFQVVAVVTQPDRPSGRALKLQPSAVKELAIGKQLPVLQPERARNEEFIQQLRALQPDLIVVVAYGQILPKAILELPRFGCVNVHTSILPKYRGAAPIQWAILEGERETGVTIMKMDAGLDTGDILTVDTTPIRAEDNSQTLHDRLAQIGAKLLVPTVQDFVTGKIVPHSQPEGATYARKISREDGRLDWFQPALILWNRIRAFTPWPGAFTQFGTPPILLKLWDASVSDRSGTPGQILAADKSGLVVACGGQSLCFKELQREGGRRMPAEEFFKGNPLRVGEKL